MSKALRLLIQRASALFEVPVLCTHSSAGPRELAACPPTPLADRVRFLAVSCNAICSLSRFGESTRESDFLAAAAVTTVQQLVSTLSALPNATTVPPEVVRTLFKVAKKAFPLVAPANIHALLRQVDERVNPTTFTLWGPHLQLQTLHVVARVAASATGEVDVRTFVMLEGLTLCIAQELGKLSAAEVAQLLWCLAVLQQQHTPLWAATCRRSQFLLHQMNHVSRATVLHAVLQSDRAIDSAAQRDLTAALLVATASLPRSGGGSGEAGGRWFEDAEREGGRGAARAPSRDGNGGRPSFRHPPRGEDTGGFDAAVRGRLLRTAHSLPTDMLLSLLPHRMAQSRAWPDGAGTSPDCSPDGDASDDVAFLLSELARRQQISPTQAICVLRTIIFPLLASRSAASPGSSDVELPFLTGQLRALATTSMGALVQTSAQDATRPHDICLCLAMALSWAAQHPGGEGVLPPLHPAQRAELFGAVVAFARELLRRGSGAFGVMSGESLWACAVAHDVAARCGVLHGVGLSSGDVARVQAGITEAVTGVPDMWRQRSEREMYEQATAVVELACGDGGASCAFSPSPTPVPAEAAARTLLLSCVKTLASAARLPAAITARALAAVEMATSGQGRGDAQLPEDISSAFASLSRHLVVLLEAAGTAAPRALLLAEVGSLLLAKRTTPPRAFSEKVSPAPDATSWRLHTHDALLDLYVRLLQAERAHSLIAPQHAEVLVRCLAQRAEERDAGGALERGFMLLCTRRLGQKQSFLKSVQLPPDALVAMIHLAEAHLHPPAGARNGSSPSAASSASAATILASLLEHILPTGGPSGPPAADAVGRGAVPQCRDLASLNAVASLLSLPTCAELGLKEPLARTITQQAIRLTQKVVTPPRDRAMLVAYYVRAEVNVSDELLAALRAH